MCDFELDNMEEDEDFWDYPDECSICGGINIHNIGCPEDNSPFAQLIKEGYD